MTGRVPSGSPAAPRRTSRGAVAVGATVAVGVVATVAAAAGLVAGLVAGPGDGGCPRTLRVAAAPEMVPVLRILARELPRTGPDCVAVSITSATALAVVTDLADGRIRPPDVWVPDSSLWLSRADDDRVASVEGSPSLATSPLVLAMTRDTAHRVRASGTPRTADLVAAAAAGIPVHVVLSGQRLSPQRVGAVVALTAATHGPEQRAGLAGLLRLARVGPDDPPDPGAALDRPGAVVVPTSEQALAAADRDDLDAIRPGTVSFDYPYAVLSRDPATRAAADRLLGLVTSPHGQREVQAHGLRDVHGDPGPDAPDRVARPPRPLSPASLTLAEETLVAVGRDARLTAVLDVSGSMAWGIDGPGSPGPSRLRLATAAALRGMDLYPDTTRVGVLAFPGPSPARPVATLASVAGLGASRTRLARTLRTVVPVPGGSTPLYAATRAAVVAATRGFDPDRVNAVVLLSDGHDTGGGPSLADLLVELRSRRTTARPIPVITIAFGPDSDASALARISRASGGSSYRADSPAAVRRVFLDALSRRVCRPDCRSAA